MKSPHIFCLLFPSVDLVYISSTSFNKLESCTSRLCCFMHSMYEKKDVFVYCIYFNVCPQQINEFLEKLYIVSPIFFFNSLYDPTCMLIKVLVTAKQNSRLPGIFLPVCGSNLCAFICSLATLISLSNQME